MNDQQSAAAMSPEGLNPRFDHLLQAIARGVREHGLENVTIDDVAASAGVSRATMYRRFGSRDGMLKAYLLRRSSEMIERGREIAAGPGDVGERLEGIFTFMVLGVDRPPLVKRERSATGNALVQASVRRFFNKSVIPMLAQAEAAGTWASPAPLDELASWLTDEYFSLVRLRGHDEAEVRRHLRTYIMPVLNLRAPIYDVDALATRVEALQREFAALAALLQAQRPDRRDGPGGS